eukprot:6409575-Prorocentrum_lima.AAC.1
MCQQTSSRTKLSTLLLNTPQNTWDGNMIPWQVDAFPQRDSTSNISRATAHHWQESSSQAATGRPMRP